MANHSSILAWRILWKMKPRRLQSIGLHGGQCGHGRGRGWGSSTSRLPLLLQFSSVQFSRSVVSDSLRPHERSTPGLSVHHQLQEFTQIHVHRVSDAIQPSSVVPFSSCPQSLPASESFPMSQLFAWDGQNIGVSASASVLPMNTQDWSPLGWIGWISLQSKGFTRVFSNTTVQKHQFFGAQLSFFFFFFKL